MRLRHLIIGTGAAALALAAAFWWLSRPPEPVNPVTASGEPETLIMDLSRAMPLDPPPAGWWHRTFWTRPAMEIAFEQHDGRTGLACRTHGSGSIFGRFTDIAVADYPRLAWTWRMDQPVETDLDERTREGDDHPIRLFLAFANGSGQRRAMEIIWSNGAFQPGQYKFIGDFAHYVARSGTTMRGRWLDEEIDLAAIYRHLWPDDTAPRLTFIALFCDTDDAGARSQAALGRVAMKR